MSCDGLFFQAEDGIRDLIVTGVQTCALPIWRSAVCAGDAREPTRRRSARIVGELALERHPRRPRFSAYEGHDLEDRIVDAQRRGPRRRSPAERANALDDLAGAVAVVEDVVDGLAGLFQNGRLASEPAETDTRVRASTGSRARIGPAPPAAARGGAGAASSRPPPGPVGRRQEYARQ